jgi:N-acetylmuramoyl-L-alanine amidase
MRRLKWLVLFVVLMSLLVSSAAFAAPAQSVAVQQWGGGYWYSVRWGDTLSSIGRATGVSPWSIANANGLANPNYIYCGQQLWIPAGPPPQPHPQPMPGCGYRRPVYFGDTLYSIAWSTGVSWHAIAAANGLYNTNVIYAGSSLWIPCHSY